MQLELESPGLESQNDGHKLEKVLGKKRSGSASDSTGGWTHLEPLDSCCVPLGLAWTSVEWSQNQDCSPHASMSRPGCLLLLKLFDFSNSASDFLSFGNFPEASDIPFLIHLLLNERDVTTDNHQESAYERRSLGSFSVNTVLCPLLWAELVP